MMNRERRKIMPFLRRTMILMLAISLFILPGVTQWGPSEAIHGTDIVLADNANDYQEKAVVVRVAQRRVVPQVADRYDLELLDDIGGNSWLMGIPDERTVREVIGQMHRDPQVQSAEPNYFFEVPEVNVRTIIHVDGSGGAGSFYQQAAVDVIQAPEAQLLADGSGVVVAVIDTGIDSSHPALGNAQTGHDYIDNDDDPSEINNGDLYGHGTMVAGLITLVAPGVSILPVRAFDSDGRGSTTDIAKAIRFAVRNGADIINMSFGTINQPQAIRGAIHFAKRNAILITSVGNDGTGYPQQYPASEIDIIAVAATDLMDYKADFSNYGSHVHVSAPGVGVVSAYPGGGYATADGTSFSTALVSGTVALALSAGSRDAARAVENTTVDIYDLNPSYRGLLGHGRIDALAAVSDGQ